MHGIKRIAISTGGGDAPGLNAVIRGAVLAALNRGWDVLGIRDGFNGLLFPERYEDGGLTKLDAKAVSGITHIGGTIIGTTNKNNPLRFPVKNAAGEVELVDRTEEIVQACRRKEIDAVVAIGGDGSLEIAHALSLKGLRVVGVPKTIDNDLEKTVITFGFDTAVSFATQSIDRLHSTAKAHQRIMVVEVMGRYAGWIALNSGVAANASIILIPEIEYDIDKVCAHILDREKAGKEYSIAVVAEGARPLGGDYSVVSTEAGRKDVLGGAGESVARAIQSKTGREARTVVLGHLLRGGTPTAFDRLLSLRFGAAAVRALSEGHQDIMVALAPPTVNYVPLEEVSGRMKLVPRDSDVMRTARELGICFGD
jgi:ATP-dependent phosphofructokinase / diphosphate-dependent phosphofructokinase